MMLTNRIVISRLVGSSRSLMFMLRFALWLVERLDAPDSDLHGARTFPVSTYFASAAHNDFSFTQSTSLESAARMSEQPRFTLLANTIPGSEAEKWLGRVVLDQEVPDNKFVPDRNLDPTLSHPRDIFNTKFHGVLCEEAVEIKDFEEIMKSWESTQAQTRMSKILQSFAGKSKQQEENLTMPTVTRYFMENSEEKFWLLMKEKSYRSCVVKLAEQAGPDQVEHLRMVTGILVVQGLSVQRTDAHEKTIGAQAGLPSETTTLPSALDLEAGASHLREGKVAQKSHYTKEVIFGMSFSPVIVPWLQKKGLLHYLKSKIGNRDAGAGDIHLGRPDPGQGLPVFMGKEDVERQPDREAPTSSPVMTANCFVVENLKSRASSHTISVEHSHVHGPSLRV